MIEEGITSIGNEAFSEMNEVDQIELPSTLTSIGSNAFESCSSLKTVKIPEKVEKIGQAVFFKCSSLESIIVNGHNEQYQTIDGVLMTKDGKRIVHCPTKLEKKEYVIPDGVEVIGKGAFTENTIELIVFPDTLKIIGDSASMEVRTLFRLFFHSIWKISERNLLYNVNSLTMSQSFQK